MGRKRDKGFDGAPKRRTILQINKSSLNSTQADSPSHVAAGNPQKAHNPLGLLAHYGDSDDEGSDDDAPTPLRQAKGGFIGVDGNKPKNEMDEKVADFLAEIDALDPEAPEEEGGEEEHPSELPAAASVANKATEEDAEAPALPDNAGGWQELLDENTKCIYYWNTITNDVTWDMPAGFQATDMTEGAAPAEEPVAETATAPQVSEPIKVKPLEEKEKVVEEEATVDVETKKVVKEEDASRGEGVKKVSSMAAKVVAKTPVLDMFADEEEDREEVAKAESKKMPVYGSLKVEYDLDSEEEDENEDDEKEEVTQAPVEPSKPGTYSMFVKGDVLPGSKDEEASNDATSLSHYDVTLGEVAQESQLSGATNGDAAGEQADDDDDVVEMEIGDDIDIDQQLELALERKKAELAQLEEMEKGSSSPTQKRKMSSPLNIYDEKGEVNLLSFKKKRLENMKGQKHVQKCDQSTQCDEELNKVATEDEKYQNVKKLKAEANLKKELSELGSTLTSKLEYLGQSKQGLSKLQVLLIEIETRILDWREGALDGKHLLRKLQAADWELQQKESEAVPPGWTCTWNRTHKQYYYTNSATGESQWDYPMQALVTKEQQERWDASGDGKDSRVMFNRASSQDDSEARARGSMAMLRGSVTSMQLTAPSLAEHLSRIATPPPPPPPPSAPSPEPPGIPPLPDDAPPLPSDPPPPGTGPDLPPLPPSPPPMPPSPPTPPEDSDDDNESEGPSSRPLTPPPLPPFTSAASLGIPPAPPDTDGAVIGKPQILYTTAPSAPGATISKPPDIGGGIDGMPVGDYGGAPTIYGAPPAPPSGEPNGGIGGTSSVASQPVKKKKKSKKSSTVKKKMPLSLVEKWKQIQEAQVREEEEKRRKEEEEEMMVDPSLINQKRIAEWKKQQLEAGASTHNPNFETIRGDWRERLKRK